MNQAQYSLLREALSPANINVTQDAIDRGVAGKCTLCPIAIAITSAIPAELIPFVMVKAGLLSLGVTDNIGRTIASILPPSNAVIFMRNFDTFQPVEPFSMRLYFAFGHEYRHYLSP